MSNVLLQAALDYVHRADAEAMAELLDGKSGGEKYIIELGTPLIKNVGLETLVPAIRDIVGDNTIILTDLKTLDTGALEVRMAHDAGADGVGIAGAAEEKTIKSALKAALEYGMKIIEIDSISTEKIPGRVDFIVGAIIGYNAASNGSANGPKATFEYHIPIDIQAEITNGFEPAREISKKYNIPVAVAGGLDANTIPGVLDYAQICVVGGGITRPKKGTPKDALEEIMNILYDHNNRNNGHKKSGFEPDYVAFET